jgi:hypothetical protein
MSARKASPAASVPEPLALVDLWRDWQARDAELSERAASILGQMRTHGQARADAEAKHRAAVSAAALAGDPLPDPLPDDPRGRDLDAARQAIDAERHAHRETRNAVLAASLPEVEEMTREALPSLMAQADAARQELDDVAAALSTLARAVKVTRTARDVITSAARPGEGARTRARFTASDVLDVVTTGGDPLTPEPHTGPRSRIERDTDGPGWRVPVTGDYSPPREDRDPVHLRG